MNTIRTTTIKDQRGIISIVVTVVLILVISLLVMSYAKVIRREQNIQLDRQLSSRAFYAAESGVNIAKEKISAGRTTNKTDCGGETGGGSGKIDAADLILDAADNNTKITCLLIDQAPTSFEFASISDESRVILVRPASGDLKSLKINWRAEMTPSVNGCVSTAGAFPTNAAAEEWACGHPLLRVDLVPAGSKFNRTNLQDELFTAFLYPINGAVSSYAISEGKLGKKGSILPSGCSSGICSATITGLDGSGAFYDEYMLRVMSLYGSSMLELQGLDSSAAPLNLTGEQAVIDSTAVVSGVSRRIQVRVPIGQNRGLVPDFAILSAGDVCKQYSVASGTAFFQTGGCAAP